jgi:hypothetical protein
VDTLLRNRRENAVREPVGGVEGWLPIAGMMNTKYLVETHSIPQIHLVPNANHLSHPGM